MYVTTTDKLDPSSSIMVASGPATQVEINKVLHIWPNMSDSVENLALLYRRQQAELNAKNTDFKRLWSEVDDQDTTSRNWPHFFTNSKNLTRTWHQEWNTWKTYSRTGKCRKGTLKLKEIGRASCRERV